MTEYLSNDILSLIGEYVDKQNYIINKEKHKILYKNVIDVIDDVFLSMTYDLEDEPNESEISLFLDYREFNALNYFI
jgi:hypothetical protein